MDLLHRVASFSTKRTVESKFHLVCWNLVEGAIVSRGYRVFKEKRGRAGAPVVHKLLVNELQRMRRWL